MNSLNFTLPSLSPSLLVETTDVSVNQTFYMFFLNFPPVAIPETRISLRQTDGCVGSQLAGDRCSFLLF